MNARLLIACLGLLALLAPAVAVQPDEVLRNPALEQRARHISSGLRCLVCQNQSIDDSDAPLARDLRLMVRERLVAGDTDQGVTDFVVARYGDFVLLRPPFNTRTVLLWAAPFAILLLGFGFAWRKRRASAADAAVMQPLSEDEEERLNTVLRNDGG